MPPFTALDSRLIPLLALLPALLGGCALGTLPVRPFHGAQSLQGSGAPTSATLAARDLSSPEGLWLWAAEQPPSTVSLSVTAQGARWSVDVDSQRLALVRVDDTMAFDTSDGNRFSGRLAADRSELHGFWYQPATPLDYQRVATPVVLKAMGGNRWQANLALQPRSFRVFLDVFRNQEGQLSAVIRNPEGNNVLGASMFRVEAQEKGAWFLVSGSGEQARRHAMWLDAADRLRLQHDRFAEPIVMTPASKRLAEGYHSRSGDRREAHMAPPSRNDGWQTAAPQDAGFDPAKLDALIEKLANADPRARRPQLIHSLLVARGGKLVVEAYFFGHDRETRHDVRSLGKVFGSVMVGALQQQGHAIDASHRPVAALLDAAGKRPSDPRKADITLGQLMTYTSGLDCNDVASDSLGTEERMWEQRQQGDYWLFTSSLPMLHDPGRRYAYCSGSANLVGASLRRFGGTSVHQLFDRLIAKPMNFGSYHWPIAPNGEGYLGGGAYLLPRDVLKVGALYLNGGHWNGRQIVSKSWIGESTTARLPINPQTTGMTADAFAENYAGGSQAYIWRTDTLAVGDKTYACYEASGNGGQLLIVVPDLDLAVAISGGNYRQGGIWGRWRNEIVGGHLIPALANAR